MTAPLFLTSRQVAAAIGLPDAAAFLRQRARLEDDHGFPLPMPTLSMRNLRWRADQVAYWVETHGRPKAPAMPMLPPGGNVVLLQRAASA